MELKLKEYYNQLANIDKNTTKEFDKLSFSYIDLIKNYPEQKEAYYCLIILAANNRKFDFAHKLIEKYIRNNGRNAEILYLQGRIFDEEMIYEKSIAAYESSLEFDSRNRKAWFNRALAQLSLGQLDEGALGYSFRNFEEKHKKYFLFEKWDGVSAGGNVLIWAEQGLGDEIMFYRLLPHLEKIKNHYILYCDKRLRSLIEKNYPKIEVLSSEQELDRLRIDKQIPCGDLFVYFHKELVKETFCERYLRPVNRPDIQALFPPTRKKYIGLSWLSMNAERGAARSISAIQIMNILDPQKHIIVNMQYLAPKSEIEIFTLKKFEVIDQIDAFQDIEGLAQAMCLCDAIVTIDNTTLHLAGAMGKNTFGLIPLEPNWRWMMEKEKTIWYKSVRLIRQTRLDDWNEPLNRIAKELLFV